MAGLCTADLLTPEDIRLHVLYVFPLAAITFYCPIKWMPASGFFVSFFAQLLTLFFQHSSTSAFVTEILVAFASSCLTVTLARKLRISYLSISHLADSDTLTGLYNRRRFQHIVEAEIARQVRYGGSFSIIAIDLNNFKKLNDSEGHHMGDQALILLASALLTKIRQSDSIARLGGDEFAILLPQTDDENCDRISEQLSVDIDHAMAVGGFPISASVGRVTFNHAPSSTSAALQAADKAMYRVKAASKFNGGANAACNKAECSLSKNL